ncbi:MAG: ATP-binding protein [Candidatus Binatia bacterium]
MPKVLRWLSSDDVTLDGGAPETRPDFARPRDVLAGKGILPWLALSICMVLLLAIFAADALTPTDIIFSLIYTVPLLLGAWTRDLRLLWGVALLAICLDFIAYAWGGAPVLTLHNVTLNRVLAAGQILVIAGLLHAVVTHTIRLKRINRIITDVMEQMPAGVIIAGAPSATIRFANRQAALQWRDTAQPRRPAFEVGLVLAGGDDRRAAGMPADLPLLRSLRSGTVVRGQEIAVLRADGSAGVVRAFSTPVRDRQGDIIGAVMTFNDITELKQAEHDRQNLLDREHAARTEAEAANRAKDDFFSNLSHELRAPLSVVRMWLGLLRTGNLDRAQTARALELIASNAALQARIIDDLLDVSRIVLGQLTLEFSTVELPALVAAAVDAVRPSAAAKGIRLTVKVTDAARDLTVRADPPRLQQVLGNLLSNAIKFTPGGGRVTVSLHGDESHAEIAVADTGQGIPAELVPHIFKGFRQAESDHTRRHSGLGLGLKIVRHLVDLHGGTIVAESLGVGHGATFRIRLALATPASRAAVAPAAPPIARAAAHAGGAALQGVRALLVEDDAGIREGIAAVLEHRGARALTAGSCAEALAVLEREPVDLLLADIAMPGADGYALLRQLRARPPAHGGAIPAVALTAYAGNDERHRTRAAGFAAYVAKPVDPDDLVTVVAGLTGRQRPA